MTKTNVPANQSAHQIDCGLGVNSVVDRALIRVLKFANQHNLQPTNLVAALSNEYPGPVGTRLRMLANQLAAGDSVVDAIEKIPGVLDSVTVAALRVAQESNRLPVALDVLLADDRVTETESERPWENPASDSWRLATTVMLAFLMVSFFSLKIMPTFEQMFIEFDLELPIPTLLLVRASPFLPLLMLVGLLMAIVVVLLRSPEIVTSISRLFRPLGRNQRFRASRVSLLSLIAFTAESDQPVMSGLETLAASPFTPRQRQLKIACELIREGRCDSFTALAQRGLLSRHDARALNMAGSKGGQAWLLRRAARTSSQRRRLWTHVFARTVSVVTMVIVGCIVVWAAIAVFMCLFSLTGALA